MFDNTAILGEVFEASNASTYQIDEQGMLQLSSLKMELKLFGITENYRERLHLLSQVDNSKNMVLRIHLHSDEESLIRIAIIVKELETLGFKFIALSRKFDEIALSYLIAASTGKYKINSIHDGPVTVTNLHWMKVPIDILYKNSLSWEKNLLDLDIPYESVKFETIVPDLIRIFNVYPSYSSEKTIKGNHLDYIENKQEVIDFLKEYKCYI